MYFKDFSSGAMIENIVRRAKKLAIKRLIGGGNPGIRVNDLIESIHQEYKEHEDLPNTTNPDDWAKISGKKGERIVYVRTLIKKRRRRRHRRPLDRAGRHRPVPLADPDRASRRRRRPDCGHARGRHAHRLAASGSSRSGPEHVAALVEAVVEDPAAYRWNTMPRSPSAAHGDLRRRRRRPGGATGDGARPSPPSAGPTTGSSAAPASPGPSTGRGPTTARSRRTDGTPDVVEIGYTWLAASAQRTGINVEAKRLMLAHAVRHLGGAPGLARHRRAQPPVAPADRGRSAPGSRASVAGRAHRRRRHGPRLGPLLDHRRRSGPTCGRPRPPPRRLVPPRRLAVERCVRSRPRSRRHRRRIDAVPGCEQDAAGPSGSGSEHPGAGDHAGQRARSSSSNRAVASAPIGVHGADGQAVGAWPRCARRERRDRRRSACRRRRAPRSASRAAAASHCSSVQPRAAQLRLTGRPRRPRPAATCDLAAVEPGLDQRRHVAVAAVLAQHGAAPARAAGGGSGGRLDRRPRRRERPALDRAARPPRRRGQVGELDQVGDRRRPRRARGAGPASTDVEPRRRARPRARRTPSASGSARATIGGAKL